MAMFFFDNNNNKTKIVREKKNFCNGDANAISRFVSTEDTGKMTVIKEEEEVTGSNILDHVLVPFIIFH